MARFSSTQQQPPRDTLYWKVFNLDLTIMERKSISEIKNNNSPFMGRNSQQNQDQGGEAICCNQLGLQQDTSTQGRLKNTECKQLNIKHCNELTKDDSNESLRI